MTGVVLALVGAAVAGIFASRLWRQWLDRRRNHALAWGLSLTLYAVGMVALAVGFAVGWGAGSYGTYWLTGALLNVPLLAVGELHLLAPGRAAVWWTVAGAATAWAVVATALSQFDPTALKAASGGGAIPLGSAVLAGQPAHAALQPLTLTGTVVVLAGTVWSAVRQRRPAVLLIALGVAIAGSSSVFVRGGLDALVPVALTGGVTTMYAGFRATTARRGTVTHRTAPDNS
jgi:hypothetical protein